MDNNEMEHFVSVALSSVEDGKNRRNPLNLLLILDISGSMRYSVDYEFYKGGKKCLSKMEICIKCINYILSVMKKEENLGIILFDHNVNVMQDFEQVGKLDMKKMQERVSNIKERGGTAIKAALSKGFEMFEKLGKNNNTNRLILLTDGNTSSKTEEKEVIKLFQDMEKKLIFSTVVGIGIEFNDNIIDELIKLRGGNYFTVNSDEEFEKILKDDFNYIVTPLVFDVSLSCSSKGLKVIKFYGTSYDDDEKKQGKLIEIDSVSASQKDERGIKGGIVLLKLEKKLSLNDDLSKTLSFNLDYTNLKDEKKKEVKELNFQEKVSKLDETGYENSGIRKCILLSRYNDFCRYIVRSAKNYKKSQKDDFVSSYKGTNFKIPKLVKEDIVSFKKYFESEMKILGDRDLEKELDVLKQFIDKDFKSSASEPEKVTKKELEDKTVKGTDDPSKWEFSKIKHEKTIDNNGYTKEQMLGGMYHLDGNCNQSIDPSIEICFAFDVTGSMSRYIHEVRKNLKSLVINLLTDIPSIRISVIANSDYCDYSSSYVMKKVDLTNHLPTLTTFIEFCTDGGGGDIPENYEQVLLEAKSLSWSEKSSSKSLVIVADADPHKKNEYFGIDWEEEVKHLAKMGIKCYGVQCGDSSRLDFYRKIADRTGGLRLELKNIKDILEIFVGLCYREETTAVQLKKYQENISKIEFPKDRVFINLEEVGSLDFVNKKEVIEIHKCLQDRKAKKVTIRGSDFDVESSSGCRTLKIADVMFVEQAKDKLVGEYKKLLKDKKITWITVGGLFGYVVEKI